MTRISDEDLQKLLDDAPPGPWGFAETWSDDGQEYFGSGVLIAGRERVWLEDSAEDDIPIARLIAITPALATEVLALRKRVAAADALAGAVEHEVARSRRHLAAGTFAALAAYEVSK